MASTLPAAPAAVFRAIDKGIRRLANPKVAAGQAKYMRNQYDFLGVRMPQVAAVTKTAVKDHPELLNGPCSAAMQLCVHLLHQHHREFHASSCVLARALVETALKHSARAASAAAKAPRSSTPKRRRTGAPSAVSEPAAPCAVWLVDGGEEVLATARVLVTTKPWWDTVDVVATSVVGPLVKRFPALQHHMDAWVADGDHLWVRRTAILHQLKWKGDTDTARLFKYCAAQKHDEDFFIRKAIGWALREYSKTDATAVREFVRSHPELSKLSVREALRIVGAGS